MTTEATTIMTRLREETRELHTAAERHPFQQSLANGSITRGSYVAYLGQILFVHRTLEEGLRRHVSHPNIASVVDEEQFQEPNILEDLRYFDVDAAHLSSFEETDEVVEGIAETARFSPVGLLGMHYVLEGSKNGARFISRPLAGALRLTDGGGLKYMLPYGDAQPAKWAQFKAAMEEAEFSDEDSDLLVSSASKMFLGVFRVSDGVLRAMGEKVDG